MRWGRCSPSVVHINGPFSCPVCFFGSFANAEVAILGPHLVATSPKVHGLELRGCSAMLDCLFELFLVVFVRNVHAGDSFQQHLPRELQQRWQATQRSELIVWAVVSGLWSGSSMSVVTGILSTFRRGFFLLLCVVSLRDVADRL